MKRGMYSNEWISAENQSTKINLQAYTEEFFFNCFAENFVENLNLVKSYDKTNPDVFVFSLWRKYRWGLTSFGQYIYRKCSMAGHQYV